MNLLHNVLAAIAADPKTEPGYLHIKPRAIKDAAQIGAGMLKQDEQAQQIGRLQAEIRMLEAQLFGKGLEPRTGCRFAAVRAGQASVVAEYEYTPGEAANHDVDSPSAGPGSTASVCIVNVLVNGKFIDPQDIASDEVIELWEQRIVESLS